VHDIGRTLVSDVLRQAIWEMGARTDVPRWFSANEGQQVFQFAVITGSLSFLASPGLCSHLLCLLVGKLLHKQNQVGQP